MASKYAQPSPPDTDSGLDTVHNISGKRLKDQTIDFYEHFSCISIYCQIYIRNWNGTDQKGNQYQLPININSKSKKEHEPCVI